MNSLKFSQTLTSVQKHFNLFSDRLVFECKANNRLNQLNGRTDLIELKPIFGNQLRSIQTFSKYQTNEWKLNRNLTTNTLKSKSLLKTESQLKLAELLSKCPIDSFPLLRDKDFESNGFELNFKQLFDAKRVCEEIQLNNVLYYPSVTTILNTTMSVQSLVALDKWKKLKISQLGEQGFRDYQKNILNRGKLLHLNIKNYIQTRDESTLTLSPNIEKLWKSLSNVFQDISDVQLCETPVTHPLLYYKGIVDCVAHYSGKLVIIEWKTSEKLKPTLKDIYDNPLQAVAYLGAVNYETNHSLSTDEVVLIYAYEDGSEAQIHRLNAQQCHQYWNQWLTRVKSYWDLIAFKQTIG